MSSGYSSIASVMAPVLGTYVPAMADETIIVDGTGTIFWVDHLGQKLR